MHELGIASSVLEAVEAEARRHPGARVVKVGLRIGELAGVDARALRFCFTALVKATKWETVALEIEAVRRRNRCRDCGAAFAVLDHLPDCPGCGSPRTELIDGDELELAYLEVDSDETGATGAEDPE